MGYFIGTLTCPASTGDVTISSLPFTPTWVRVTIGNKTTTPVVTSARHTVGFCDGTTQVATASLVTDAGATYNKEYSNKLGAVLSTPSGVLTDIVLFTWVEFPTNACKLNFTAVDTNFKLLLEFGN